MWQVWDPTLEKNIRFIHPIKTAGTSISDWLGSNYNEIVNWPHQPWYSVPLPEKPTFTFVVFRNPWDRLESIYWEIGRAMNKKSLPITQEEWNKGFENFVKIFDDNFFNEDARSKKLEFTRPDGFVIKPWMSQLAHWPKDQSVHVLNFNNLDQHWVDMWNSLGVESATSLPHSRHYPHPESLHTTYTKKVVEKIWPEDVEYFLKSS